MRLNLDTKTLVKALKQESITPEKGEAKRRTVELIKKGMDEPYEFFQPLHHGNAMVHRIRVELSRFRAQIREKFPGKPIRHFKVIAEVTPKPDVNTDHVKMWKTQGGNEKITNELSMILGKLVLGDNGDG